MPLFDSLAGQGGSRQGRVDDVVGRKQADMAVGELDQIVMALVEKVRWTPLGDHQRQYLAQGETTGRFAGGVGRGAGECAVDLFEVRPVPDSQAFGHAVDFTVARHGRQWHAVEVVTHDALACLQGVRTALVGTHAGRNHLPNLLRTRTGQAVGGMAVFLQLRGQGAATGRLSGQREHLGHLRPGRLGKARPIHGRVEQGLLVFEQAAILDEQQAVHHHRRDLGEFGIELLWVAIQIQGVAPAIGDHQSGLGLFLVGHEQVMARVAHQRRRKAGLLLHDVVALEQPRKEIAQRAVPQALVERAIARIDDRLAWPRFYRVRQ
jgi:hypothetical protein